LLWHASNPDNLPTSARQEIQDASTIYVSSISAWEIGMLVQKGRLALSFSVDEWISLTSHLPKLKWIDVTPDIAVRSTMLPEQFHGDPADRIIVASAMSYDTILITADKKIQSYKHVRTIW
jgi:PIN domain nuclease of toxin-antitoxin system